MSSIEYVISAGNNPYQLWQSMLFHYSCWKHQGQVPLIVVHNGDEPMLEGFDLIVAAGGRIQAAPNYREKDGIVYSPRNTPLALRVAETNADLVMLCEPDMVFLRPFDLDSLDVGPRTITLDRLKYLTADKEEYQPALDEVCQQSGVDPQTLRKQPLNGGVPHILSTALKADFSNLWSQGIDLFVERAKKSTPSTNAEPSIHWVSGMWSTVLAIHRMKLTPAFTDFCILNEKGTQLIEEAGQDHPLIHYCYGDSSFNKRDYLDLESALDKVWRVPPDDGTVSGAIRKQLREAREFYDL